MILWLWFLNLGGNHIFNYLHQNCYQPSTHSLWELVTSEVIGLCSQHSLSRRMLEENSLAPVCRQLQVVL